MFLGTTFIIDNVCNDLCFKIKNINDQNAD